MDIEIGPDLDVDLTKTKFNELCDGLFTKAIDLIDETLRMAQLHENDISHVVYFIEIKFSNLVFFFLNKTFAFRFWWVDLQEFLPLKSFSRENSEGIN